MDNVALKKQRRNTVQKRIILKTLRDMGSHQSAGAVYRKVSIKNPTIGRATVFRVLADMAEDGLLLRIPMNGAEDIYDVTVKSHYHGVCRICGKVSDVWMSKDFDIKSGIADPTDLKIEGASVEFTGICAECESKEQKKAKTTIQ